MEEVVNKFDYLSQLYGKFTKKNKENLMKTAKHLLKVQKEDAVMLTEALAPSIEAERSGGVKAGFVQVSVRSST